MSSYGAIPDMAARNTIWQGHSELQLGNPLTTKTFVLAAACAGQCQDVIEKIDAKQQRFTVAGPVVSLR